MAWRSSKNKQWILAKLQKGHGEVIDELFSACQPASEPWTCVAVRVFGSWTAASRLFMQGHATRLTRSAVIGFTNQPWIRLMRIQLWGFLLIAIAFLFFGGRRRFRATPTGTASESGPR